MYKYKNKLTVKKGMKRYVARRRYDIERQIRQRQCLISLERLTITFWDVIIENELVWSEHMSIMCNEIERKW